MVCYEFYRHKDNKNLLCVARECSEAGRACVPLSRTLKFHFSGKFTGIAHPFSPDCVPLFNEMRRLDRALAGGLLSTSKKLPTFTT